MASYSFKLPDIGEGIASAEIVGWHVKPGDWLEEDAPLVDLMTDKATVEMSAPVSGRVTQVAGEVGDQIAIGAMLVVFEVEDGGEAASDAPAAAAQVAPAEATPAEAPKPAPALPSAPVAAAAPAKTAPVVEPAAAAPPPASAGRARVTASPAVRLRAKDLGIDLAEIKPAEGDRIRHADIDAFLRYNAGVGYAVSGKPRADEEIRVVGLRRRIAENMAAAKRHIPHFSYIEEVDVTKLEALRNDLNATRGDKPKLNMLPLLITAMCKALPDYPMMNARYDDEAGIVRRFGAVHLGVATQTDAGLMVPVIRNAERRNIWQLASEIARLADAARRGQAKSDELSGSTITVTSLGALGGIATTPVINRPEVAIVGPNKVVERPVVRDGAIVIAKLMNVSVSCDHRVVDGWDAANFVQLLKRLLETPALLFVD